jgi:hypothetical protein
MAFNSDITPGRPPLLWSDVNDAFDKVNENFDILVATIGDGSGLTPLNFETLDTNLNPTDTNTYQLGNILKQWKSVYTAGWSSVAGSELNGLWAGSAQIKGVGLTVNLPENSTIGGDPATGIGVVKLIDPDKTFFKEIQVNNNFSVVATTFGDTVNLLSGDGIALTVNSSSDSIEIDNTGILSVTAGVGISSTTVAGVANIVNTGVRSLTNSGGIGARTPGLGIHTSSSTGTPLLTNTGVLEIQAGSGALAVSLEAATGIVTITNTSPAQPAFQQVEVNGDSANRLVADSTAGVFRIVSGQGITLSKTVGTDTMTITVDPRFDLKGSIFGDDSTKIVDAVENKVYGGIFATTLRTEETSIALGLNSGFLNQGIQAVAVGATAGITEQGTSAVAIGYTAGANYQGQRAVAIGEGAGSTSQGNYAVAIGINAGSVNQGANSVAIGYNAGNGGTNANSIILNAGASPLTSSAAGFFVNPVRNQSGASGVVQYDSTTNELSYSATLGSVSGTFTGNIFTNLIDSADSSAITVTPAIIFNANVNIENDIQLSNIDASIRGTDKIKFVPSNADELSYNVRLEVYSESTIEPRLAIDTPDGVDLTLSSGLAGIVISKINSRVNLAAGNNAFIVRENGSWAMTPLDAAPVTATVGVYIANGTTWDPASKANSRPYPVWYDGVAYNALY